jgi:hypothetical protein
MSNTRTKKIADMQALMLDLIEDGSFNGFKGPKVRADLEEHRELWDAASMIPDCAGLFIRDLPGGIFHCDQLYILTDRERWKRLRPIVAGWNADSITKYNSKGTKVANRWDSEDCESYKFKRWDCEGNKSVGHFLGSGLGGEDNRVVLCLWWD